MAGYRLQAFLVVLLVLGAILDKTNGLKCYTCDACDKPSDSDAQDCDGSCFSSGSKRGCYPKDKVDCFKAAAGGDCYKPEADTDKAIAGKLNECVGEEPIGPSCICSVDLCNVDSWPGVSKSTAGRSESKGIKCYKCIGPPDSGCAKAIKIENEKGDWDFKEVQCAGTEYCEKTIIEGSVRRNCYDMADGKCWFEHVADKNGCATESSSAKLLKFFDCIADYNAKQGRSISKAEQRSSSRGDTCACKGNLCNDSVGIKTSLLITIVSALAVFVL